MAARTPRFQSWPAVSAGHTSCWIIVRSVLPHKGTDRQVSVNTCKDKTIYSQRVVETETYMGDGEWATGGGESARDPCTPAAWSAQIAQSTSCQHSKTTGGAEKAPWIMTPRPYSGLTGQVPLRTDLAMVDQRSWVHVLSFISRGCVWEIDVWVLPICQCSDHTPHTASNWSTWLLSQKEASSKDDVQESLQTVCWRQAD